MKKIFALLLMVLSLLASTSFATETKEQLAHIYAPIKAWNQGASLISSGKNENGEYVYDITKDVNTLLAAQKILLDAAKLNDARLQAGEKGRGDKGSDPKYVKKRIDTTLGVIEFFLRAKNYKAPAPVATATK